MVPGFLIKSLSDHYSSPGRLAEYKRQFQRAFRRPADDPSIFAIELETLARRAFIDIDPLIALRRHLDSLGPDTPMADIVDCCRVWESHVEVETKQQSRTDRHPPRVVCQVTEDEQSPVESPETELLEDIIRNVVATASGGGPDTVRPGTPHSAINGSDMPITAADTGALEIDRFGNHVAELASSRNSHRGGRRFARIVVGFRRRVFFVQCYDP